MFADAEDHEGAMYYRDRLETEMQTLVLQSHARCEEIYQDLTSDSPTGKLSLDASQHNRSYITAGSPVEDQTES